MLARLKRGLSEMGFAGVLFEAATMLAARLRVRLVWYVLTAQPVDAGRRLPARLGRSIDISRLDRHHPLIDQAPRPAAVLADRFRQRSVCFAASSADTLLGFLWICPQRYVEDDVRCIYALPPGGEAWWDYDVWVDADARHGIVFARLWHAAHLWLASQGASWTLSRITRANRASIGAHARLGARAIGNAWFACFGGWQLMLAASAPYVHLSRSAADMPVLRLGLPDDDGPLAAPLPVKDRAP